MCGTKLYVCILEHGFSIYTGDLDFPEPDGHCRERLLNWTRGYIINTLHNIATSIFPQQTTEKNKAFQQIYCYSQMWSATLAATSACGWASPFWRWPSASTSGPSTRSTGAARRGRPVRTAGRTSSCHDTSARNELIN